MKYFACIILTNPTTISTAYLAKGMKQIRLPAIFGVIGLIDEKTMRWLELSEI